MIDTQVAIGDVEAELQSARDNFGPFKNGHEGWAVIAEELFELWLEVIAKKQDPEKMYYEAMQTAAMAIRFMIEVCSNGGRHEARPTTEDPEEENPIRTEDDDRLEVLAAGLRSAARGDPDRWRHPDLHPGIEAMDSVVEAFVASGGTGKPPDYVRTMARLFLEEALFQSEIPDDAVDQLVDGFLPCLQIMVTRGYAKDGQTWKSVGWRGLLSEVLKKTARVHWLDWLHMKDGSHEAPDLINYWAMYLRSRHTLAPWGDRGEPGNES